MRFLVAVDGSESSEAALRYVASLADTESSVHVVHAVTPRIYTEGGKKIIEDMSQAEDRSDEILSAAEDILEEAGFEGEVQTESLYGDPVEEVSAYSEGYDGVHVGHRGNSGAFEGNVGSVARDLVERAPVTVTVVR